MPLPLIEKHRSLGAVLVKHGHCLVPDRFSNLEAEVRAAREGAALLDASDRAWLEVSGGDRVRFLHGMTTNDVKRLQPGAGCAAAMVSAKGRMVAEMDILAEPDRHWLGCRGDLRAALARALGAFIIADDVVLRDRSDDFATIDLLGPRAAEVAGKAAAPARLPEAEFDHLPLAVAGVEARVIRTSPTWGPGYRFVVSAAAAGALWSALEAAGAGAGVRPIGLAALNVLRLEAGVPWFGTDMDEGVLPVEAGLEARTISYTKGCYVGQEILARIKTYGEPAKRLVGVRLDGDRLPAPRAVLRIGGKDAGWLTSSAISPALGPIALGYLNRGCGAVGARVEVMAEGEPIRGTVSALPFDR